MSDFETLKVLLAEEIKTLKAQIKILDKAGYDTFYQAHRLAELEYSLPFWNDNADTIYSFAQASEATHFPKTREQADYERDCSKHGR